MRPAGVPDAERSLVRFSFLSCPGKGAVCDLNYWCTVFASLGSIVVSGDAVTRPRSSSSPRLEQESGFYFNMKYFEDEVQNGNWDSVEKYLSGFTKVDDNRYSMKIFFEIRKQKYLEALDRHDRSKAVEILVKDLKAFASFNEELFKEITQLLILENFSLNWQHQLCKNPRPNPDIKTLFDDHSCGQPNGALAPNNPLLGAMPKAGSFPPLGAHGPFQFAPTPVPTPLAGWMSNPSAVTHSAFQLSLADLLG
ncbi:hypothetical protein ZIOFF_049282 [Zingiber officinale]|uniref:CTLH domain-containing protein n=1 Tax=Zingiber officinale TaxID=94328 RepID=A0A8J5G1D8_ZINOF|nr:hypothetical protein ZIOFF_049282 [Zingiber officinale]